MKISHRRMPLFALVLSFALAGCGSEKGVGVATSEDAAATAKAAPEAPADGAKNAKNAPKRPKIQAEGSAASLKLEN